MTVYLLHFEQPISNRHSARHYLGWAKNLEQRLAEHERGTGARLCQVARQRGISWKLVRTWEGGRQLERQLKDAHNSPRFCPVCQQEAARAQ